MGIYDVYRPEILGPQWVPIRDDFVELSEQVEFGYSFPVTGTAVITDATIGYVETPAGAVYGHVPFIQIYPKGEEVNTGPVQSILLSVDTATVTGVSVPGDGRYIFNGSDIGLFTFPTSGASIADALNGRRILGVNLVYTAYGQFSQIDGVSSSLKMSFETSATPPKIIDYGSVFVGPESANQVTVVQRAPLGEVNPHWPPGDQYTDARIPWRYTELSRFASTTPDPNRYHIGIRATALPTGVTITFSYIALEIFYCEENRVRFGGTALSNVYNDLNYTVYSGTTQVVPLYDLNLQVTGALPVGEYTATVSLADAGTLANSGDKPKIYATHQLYEISPHPGILIERAIQTYEPRRMPSTGLFDQRLGAIPEARSSDTLPAIKLFTTQAVHSHMYGNHFGVPIFISGTNSATASQEIINNSNNVSVPYQWVRFYARYFGSPSGASLQLVVTGGGTVTISRADFDLLPEIVDGWKEVTLPITGTVFSNDGSLTACTWSMVAGTGDSGPKNQWQVIAANAWESSASTYGGTSANLTWQKPSSSRFANINDLTADAILMFSRNPVTPTALAISTQSQVVTGIGLNCDIAPNCVPTAIDFNALSWSVSGTGVVCDEFSRIVTNDWGVPDTGGVTWDNSGGLASDFLVNGSQGVITATDLNSRNMLFMPPPNPNTPLVIIDTFTRDVTGGWDTSDSGDVWITSGGSASDYSVGSGKGQLSLGSVGFSRNTATGNNIIDVDIKAFIVSPPTALGNNINVAITARLTDFNNYYYLLAAFDTSGTVDLSIAKNVGGVHTTLITVNNVVSYTPGFSHFMRFQLIGNTLRGKMWSGTESSVWNVETTDSDHTSGAVGFRSILSTGNTNTLPVLINVDDFTATPIGQDDNNYDSTVTITIPVIPIGDTIVMGWDFRRVDSNNFYFSSVEFRINGEVRISIVRVLGGAFVTISSSLVTPYVYSVGSRFKLRTQVISNNFYAKVWPEHTSEPNWQVWAFGDTSFTTGRVGARGDLFASNTNSLPVLLTYDDVVHLPISLVSATYELQRRDDVDPTWRTIMTTKNMCVRSFNDYEARVGVTSYYRIRTLNALSFPSPWSSEVSNTLPAPGVTGATDSILIFTSNERQDGLLNLAHSMSWAGSVEERFDFIEAGEVQLQRMYGRDFQVAFRPIERGGVRFQRSLLVQAAAVSPARLDEEFRELRDMSWADVPYVCVRDENGNRWFATIIMPSGVITSSRRLHIAEVDIIETTATPSIVEMP